MRAGGSAGPSPGAVAAGPGVALRRCRSEPALDSVQPLRIELLGHFRVAVGRRDVPDAAWRLRKGQSLVKLLALAPGHRLHREQLEEALCWGSPRRRPPTTSTAPSTSPAAPSTLRPPRARTT